MTYLLTHIPGSLDLGDDEIPFEADNDAEAKAFGEAYYASLTKAVEIEWAVIAVRRLSIGRWDYEKKQFSTYVSREAIYLREPDEAKIQGDS